MLAGLFLAACAPVRPPTDSLDAAAQALAGARAAGAAELAPGPLQTAQARLASARSAEMDGDYADAADLALESRVSSELAAAQARLARLRGVVEKLRRENAVLAGELRGGANGEGRP